MQTFYFLHFLQSGVLKEDKRHPKGIFFTTMAN